MYPKGRSTWFTLNFYVLLCLGTCWVYPNPSGLLYSHWGNNMIALMPVKQQFGIWVNDSCESIKIKIKQNYVHILWNTLYALRQNNRCLISDPKFGWVLCRSVEAGQTLTCFTINPTLLRIIQPLAKINIAIEFLTPRIYTKPLIPAFNASWSI